VLSIALARSGQAAAQSTAACTGPGCVDRDRLWVPAGQIHDIKNQFVAGVRQFTEAVAGTFGDEGPKLSASLDVMRRTLVQWDAAIRAYETMLAALPGTDVSAESKVALGTVYLDRDRRDDALREFAAAARLDPRRVDAHSLSGVAYGLNGKPAEAIEALRRALALDPGNTLTLYALAQQLGKTPGHGEEEDVLRRFQEASWPRLRTARGTQASAPFERVSLLRQVAGVSPIFPLHAYRAGFARLLAGQYDAAIDEFARVAAGDALTTVSGVADHASALRRGQLPAAIEGLEKLASERTAASRAEALRALGVAYWVAGRFDLSAARLSEAIQLAPQDERARVALADVLVEAGRPAEAEQALTSTVAVIPDSGQAHFRLGQLHLSQSLFPPAVHELESAAALNPLVGLDRLYEMLGGAYASQASFDNAVTAYLARIDVNPNNADAHKALGEIYALQGRHDEALAEFAATLLIDPKSVGALVGASQVFLRLGRFDEALDLSRQALAIDDRLKDARYALAMSLIRLGRQDEGRRELAAFERMQAEVMAATTRQSELNTIRRDAAQRLNDNDYAAAAALLRRAASLDPASAGVRRDLGLALARSRQYDEAIAALNDAIRLEDTAEAHRLLADTYKGMGRVAESEAQVALAARATARARAERLQKLSGAR
jgi:tetratricopeptide (TPR) repeat protein